MNKRGKDSIMGKKTYVTPMAVEEAFVANCYVAKCNNSVKTVTKNQYQCVNPYHTHVKGDYIGSVWVEGVAGDQCTHNITDADTQMTKSSDGYHPSYGAIVYGRTSGETYTCTVQYRGEFYVPSGTSETSPCWGSYIYSGTSIDKFEQLFS